MMLRCNCCGDNVESCAYCHDDFNKMDKVFCYGHHYCSEECLNLANDINEGLVIEK